MDVTQRYADSRAITMQKKPSRPTRLATALGLVAGLLIPLVASATPQQLSAPVAQDVRESYRLLTSTYYVKVTSQSLLDAARSALIETAHKHGARVDVPALSVQPDTDTTMAQLDQEIESVASAAHGSPTEYAYAAINGMAKSVKDRWTAFLNPTEFKAFNEELDPQKISGIGVLIEQDPATKLVRASYVVPGTPADKAGILPGDNFVSINGVSTKGLTQAKASSMLRGQAGTVVHIAIAHSGSTPIESLAITRSEIQPPTVIYKMLSDHIGYVYVLAFGRATPTEFDAALSRLKEGGARALVLDLRNDGGGYVDSALEISSRLISNKPLVTVEQRGVANQTINAQNDTQIDVPVTVLVNGYTASASEITAGALQDDGVGVLVGSKTFGKGVMQTLTALPDGSAIKITTAHYLTPNGSDINLKGIEPNLRIGENRGARFGDVKDDAQLRAALGLLQKKIADAAKP